MDLHNQRSLFQCFLSGISLSLTCSLSVSPLFSFSYSLILAVYVCLSLPLFLSVFISVSVSVFLSSNGNGWQVPCYVFLGKTSLKEWKSCIQENLGPWGELATDNIILTVPTPSLKDLEDPEPLLQLWDEMMQAVARLAAQPFPFQRPERIVADVQISSGECLRGVLLVRKLYFIIILHFM